MPGQQPRGRSNPRIDRGQGPILGVLGAGRMGRRAWKGGRAWGGGKRCDGTEEERGNLRDMEKKATKDKRINQSI